jgi:hypothetical protein
MFATWRKKVDEGEVLLTNDTKLFGCGKMFEIE